MITKKEFFAILNDENNKIGVTAHMAVYESRLIPALIIRQNGAPNVCLSSHRSSKVLHATFAKYNTWLNEWLAERAASAEARMIEEDHAEALEMDNAEMSRRCRDAVFSCSLDGFGRRVIVEAAHGEALEYNAQFDSVEYPTVTRDCLCEARTMNRYVGNADLIPDSGFCQTDRDYLLAVNARLHPELLAFDIQEAHAKALTMNAELDEEIASIDQLVPDEDKKPLFKAVASHFIVGCPAELPELK